MARRLFFVDEVRLGRARIEGDLAHHLTRVLRVEPGQKYELSDNRRLYLAVVESARKSEVSFTILEPLPEPQSRPEVHLYAALIHFDRFEWIVEKATELGAASIRPLIAKRSEKGLERAAGKRIDRWRRIAREACEQSRRPRLPEILPPTREPSADFPLRLLLDESPDAPPILPVLTASLPAATSTALLLGPEGGWTEAERAHFTAAGWRQVSLGPGILRAETAAVAALAILNAAWVPYHEDQCPKT
jgi:16S rRNA (uracil1498-N3)-methyltransferase